MKSDICLKGISIFSSSWNKNLFSFIYLYDYVDDTNTSTSLVQQLIYHVNMKIFLLLSSVFIIVYHHVLCKNNCYYYCEASVFMLISCCCVHLLWETSRKSISGLVNSAADLFGNFHCFFHGRVLHGAWIDW